MCILLYNFRSQLGRVRTLICEEYALSIRAQHEVPKTDSLGELIRTFWDNFADIFTKELRRAASCTFSPLFAAILTVVSFRRSTRSD